MRAADVIDEVFTTWTDVSAAAWVRKATNVGPNRIASHQTLRVARVVAAGIATSPREITNRSQIGGLAATR
jgi:hypothetical protein